MNNIITSQEKINNNTFRFVLNNKYKEAILTVNIRENTVFLVPESSKIKGLDTLIKIIFDLTEIKNEIVHKLSIDRTLKTKFGNIQTLEGPIV